LVTVAMSTAAFLSLVTRWSANAAAVLAAALVVLWNAAIYFDSSALTAGTVQAADKGLRGATMGLHGMCGYAGGFVGPLGIGLVLDWAGSADGLGLTFGHLALIIHDRPVFLATPRRKKRGANRGCQLRLARPPLPDVPGQENGGGGAGQASESAGAEAHNPGGKLRRPPNWSSVTPNRRVPRNPAAKPMQE